MSKYRWLNHITAQMNPIHSKPLISLRIAKLYKTVIFPGLAAFYENFPIHLPKIYRRPVVTYIRNGFDIKRGGSGLQGATFRKNGILSSARYHFRSRASDTNNIHLGPIYLPPYVTEAYVHCIIKLSIGRFAINLRKNDYNITKRLMKSIIGWHDQN